MLNRSIENYCKHTGRWVFQLSEPLPWMFLVLFELCSPFLGTGMRNRVVSHRFRSGIARVYTHRTLSRGSTNDRCCMLRNRSLNKLPSGYRGVTKTLSVQYGCEDQNRLVKAHLQPSKTLTQLLGELHINFTLSDLVFPDFSPN